MPFASDRRIPPSFALRIAVGAFGGWALAGRRSSPKVGAMAGVAGAVAGTLLGCTARGPDSRTTPGRAKGLAEERTCRPSRPGSTRMGGRVSPRSTGRRVTRRRKRSPRGGCCARRGRRHARGRGAPDPSSRNPRRRALHRRSPGPDIRRVPAGRRPVPPPPWTPRRALRRSRRPSSRWDGRKRPRSPLRAASGRTPPYTRPPRPARALPSP